MYQGRRWNVNCKHPKSADFLERVAGFTHQNPVSDITFQEAMRLAGPSAASSGSRNS